MIKEIDAKPWFTGKELVGRWQILPREYFKFLKLDLQAYSRDGDEIVDSDTLARRKKYSHDEISRQVDLEQGDIGTSTVLTTPGALLLGSPRKELTEKERQEIVQARYEAQPLDTYDVPENCTARSFTLSTIGRKRKEQIKEAMDWLFKRADIEGFQKEHPEHFPREAELELVEGETAEKRLVEQEAANEFSYEDFIRNLAPHKNLCPIKDLKS